MKIKPRTLRSDMQKTSILLRVSEFIEDMAVSEGVSQQALDIHLMRFVDICTRVEFDADNLPDFVPATAADSPSVIRDKFSAYLDSQSVEIVDAALRGVDALDSPVDTTTGPAPLPEDASSKKK